MKFPHFLLAGSLLVNVVLVVLLLRLAAPVPTTKRPASSGSVRGTSIATVRVTAEQHEALLAALAAGDSAALLAAGVKPEVVRLMAAARAFARLAALEREKEDVMAGNPAEYWRQGRRSTRPMPTREQQAARLAAEREFEVAMREAFGEGWNDSSRQAREGYLTAAQRERMRAIERDYEEMRREISLESDGFQLPADREKLRLLELEMKRDLDAVLSPAEREQRELRTSGPARAVIDRYGDVIASEAEYKRIFALQKAFEDRFSSPEYFARRRSPEDDRIRAEAERQLNDEIRAELGNERWGAVSRANDNEYQRLAALATRLNLPAATADQIYAVRDSFSAQSLLINQNTALSATERKSQLTELANRAKRELQVQLGADGAVAYAPHASWLQMLQNGSAFTIDARQLPPGSARPGGGATAFALPAPRPPAPPPPKP